MAPDVLYAGEPNRLLASGGETLDAVALTFQVRTDGVRVEARTGSVSELTVDLDYGELLGVELVGEVSTGIRFETAETEYTVTNVTSSVSEARAVVDEMRSRISGIGGFGGDVGSPPGAGGDRPTNSTAPDADLGGERLAADDAATAAGSESDSGDRQSRDPPEEPEATITFGGHRRAEPGETIDCPLCGHGTLVPDEIPAHEQNVVCPGCSEVIGQTHESGEYVEIDPDP